MSLRHCLSPLLACLSIVASSACGDSNPETNDGGAESSTGAASADDTTGSADDDAVTDDSDSTATSGPSEDSTAGPDDAGSTGTDDGDSDSSDSSDTDAPQGCGENSGRPGGLALDDLIPTAAQSTCDALFRCCDTIDLEAYFAPLLDNESLADLVDQLPPNAELTPEGCPALMIEIMTVQPFGQWRDAVEAGQVSYDGVAAQTCVDAMDAADCSVDSETNVTAALFDGTCLALDPPLGGEDQRRMFERCSAPGDACVRLNDGFGGIIYGTCNPQESICCVPSEDDPEACALGAAEGAQGTCVAVSAENEPCAVIPSLQWCATGVECVDGSCMIPPVPQPAEVGDPCVDDDGFTIGDCTDSFCDFFEGVCVALREDGEQCQGGYECISGGCTGGQCGVPTFCAGPDMG